MKENADQSLRTRNGEMVQEWCRGKEQGKERGGKVEKAASY